MDASLNSAATQRRATGDVADASGWPCREASCSVLTVQIRGPNFTSSLSPVKELRTIRRLPHSGDAGRRNRERRAPGSCEEGDRCVLLLGTARRDRRVNVVGL